MPPPPNLLPEGHLVAGIALARHPGKAGAAGLTTAPPPGTISFREV